MPAHDILTLQFGHYANAVGAAFWATQNEGMGPTYFAPDGSHELDHSVLFHESASDAHPRVLMFDARDSAGLLRASGKSGGPTVRTWADGMNVRLRPGSCVALGGRSATGDAIGAAAATGLSAASDFAAFSAGRGLMHEDLLEPARRWLEESDGLQGVQVVVDVDSGWGGLASM